MSNNKDTIQSLRESLGYVNSGNTNKYMFRFNLALVAMSAIVVGLIWGIRNSDSIDKTDPEKKDLLIMGIIAATIFFLVVFPINIGRAFSGNIPRHPIYLTYAIISAIFVVYLAIYYSTVAKGGDQGGYILGALIITLIIGIVSFYLYYATTNPYSWLGLDTLSENDYYNINNEAFVEYKFITDKIANNKYRDNYDDAKKAYNLAGGTDFDSKIKNKNEYDKPKTTTEKERIFEVITQNKNKLIETYADNFFKLGILKQYYNDILKSEDKKKAYQDFRNKLDKTSFTQNTVFTKIKNDLNTKVLGTDKILTINDYNTYFGYYDPYTGSGSTAIDYTKITAAEQKAATAGNKLSAEQQKSQKLADRQSIIDNNLKTTDVDKLVQKAIDVNNKKALGTTGKLATDTEVVKKVNKYVIDKSNNGVKIDYNKTKLQDTATDALNS